MDARALHDDAIIIDGLTFLSDGYAEGLLGANIAATNLTVSHFEVEFERAADDVAAWTARLAAPDCPWRRIERAADIPAARADGKVGLIMGWQNMRPIGDNLDRIGLFHKLGLRVMQLTYNSRNYLGDGCLEPDDGGLSALGERAVGLMNQIGVAVDLSHVGKRATLRAAEISDKPVLITHANAEAVVASPRNKSDEEILAVAATGGIIGTSTYGAMCWPGDPTKPPTLDDYLRQLDYIVGLVGPAHVGIGTDFPAVIDLTAVNAVTAMTLARSPGFIGAYVAAFGNDIAGRYLRECPDHAGLFRVTEALVGRGWAEADIRGLLGGNFLRAFDEIWGG